MALEEYREKRDFAKTPEPAGAPSPTGRQSGLLYVIQKHQARRLHYDFRLELDGVLLSWAVPKGPSLNPRDRHLAARVEDHPLEYGTFEGTIPTGEYGAGTVELWDRGTWEPEIDPHVGLKKGDLKFTLHGEKLRGSWVLVRMKGRPGDEGKENWLLIKHRDDFAVDGDGSAVLEEMDRSVASGRTLEEIAAEGGGSVWHGDRAPEEQTDARPGEEFRLDASAASNAVRFSTLPHFVEPQLATLVEKAPEGERWLHEVKFDGYRALARVEDGAAEIYSRNDRSLTGHFARIAADLARLPVANAMLDGEVVVQMPDGTTSFQQLQRALTGSAADASSGSTENDPGMRAGPAGHLVYYAFDLLYLNGYDLTGSPIEERKELLKRLLSRQPGGLGGTSVMYSEYIVGGGREFLEQACGFGLEGVVSKAAGSRYRPGARGNEWLKAKCRREQEFVVGGYTEPAGSRVGFGALLLGAYESGGLRYVGRVGTGFSETQLRTLGRRLGELEIGEPPFATGVERTPKGSHWVRPELVAQVSFAELTSAGSMRHPSFKGLREDKPAEDVVVERPSDGGMADVAVESPKASAQRTRVARVKAFPHASDHVPVTLTHPDKVFWPADGLTKQGLADYYSVVAPLMLPYVLGRPISMVRCPEGIEGLKASPRQSGGRPAPCFFHKHPSVDFKGPLDVVDIVESEGTHPYFTITEAAGLTALAQMGVLEIHIWGATWPDIEHPDMLVFDFDPDAAVEWQALAEAARLMHDVLLALGLRSFVKTTGGKGLHVVAPITPREDWAVVRDFCKAIADAFVAGAPDRYTANMLKAKRAGKTYVDYVRNTRGSTSIAPYSTRAKQHATVSVPLRWEELDGDVRPASFMVANLGERLQVLSADPWAEFHDTGREQTITTAMKRATGLARA